MLHTCRGSPLCLPVNLGEYGHAGCSLLFGQTRGAAPTVGCGIIDFHRNSDFKVKGFMIHIVLCNSERGAGGFGILTGHFGSKNVVALVSWLLLQSYEKILKLTNYKQKILEKFCIGAVSYYVSSSYRAPLWKHCVQRCFRRFATPCKTTILTPFWLQITDYSLFMSPLFREWDSENDEICK